MISRPRLGAVGSPPGTGGLPVTSAQTQNFLITIYAEDGSCAEEAAIVATGTGSELDGAGIQVSQDVRLDWTTTFYATETDPENPSEPSPCSNGIAFQQVTTPPAPPEFTHTVPASPGADTLPHLFGGAAAGSTVSIFANASCSGSPVATGTAAVFTEGGIQVAVGANTTTTFDATATLAGLVSACSTSSITYEEVEQGPPGEEPPPGGEEGPSSGEPPFNPPGSPPPPRLRTAPQGIANDNTPTVTGNAPGAVGVEIFGSAGCKGSAIVSGSVAQLSQGFPVRVVENATQDFYGLAIDGGGDRSACTKNPVVYVEDSTPPHTVFTSGPGSKTRRRTVRFTFRDTTEDPSTTFRCRLDHRAWHSCRSPLLLRHLGHRHHTVAISGTDAAGNVQARAAKRSFRVIRHH